MRRRRAVGFGAQIFRVSLAGAHQQQRAQRAFVPRAREVQSRAHPRALDFAAGRRCRRPATRTRTRWNLLEPSLGICAALFTRVVDLRDENSRDGPIRTTPSTRRWTASRRFYVTHVLIECAGAGETEVSFAVPSQPRAVVRLRWTCSRRRPAAIFARERRGRCGRRAGDGCGGGRTRVRGCSCRTARVQAARARARARRHPPGRARRDGFRARRVGLGALAAAATAAARRASPPFDSTSLSPGETTRLEAALRRLARGEPCGVIARAAAEAADGVAEMLARAPR